MQPVCGRFANSSHPNFMRVQQLVRRWFLFRLALFLLVLFPPQVLAQEGSQDHPVADTTLPARCDCPSQAEQGSGTLSFAWGYNKSWFSRSSIHFSDHTTDDYDFTLYNLEAHDRPGLEIVGTNLSNLSVPQYVYRLAYFFNDPNDLGVEICFDHVKYVMTQNQTARIEGEIRGRKVSTDTVVSSQFLRFEHTNGANFWMVNFLKRQNLVKSSNRLHWLGLLGKVGVGVVIPKSDVAIFDVETDNRYHIAGYVLGLDVGLRYDFLKYGFVEASLKGAYADYSDVLTVGEGRASHSFFTLEAIMSLGFQVNL